MQWHRSLIYIAQHLFYIYCSYYKFQCLLIPVLHLDVYTFGICIGKHSRLVRRYCYFRTMSHTVKSNQICLKMIHIYFCTTYINITPGYSSNKLQGHFPVVSWQWLLHLWDYNTLSEVIKLLLPHHLTRVHSKSLSLPNLSTLDICDLFTQQVKPIPS